ncbi:unnamed protein product, partial [marine sediment metagenome]
ATYLKFPYRIHWGKIKVKLGGCQSIWSLRNPEGSGGKLF